MPKNFTRASLIILGVSLGEKEVGTGIVMMSKGVNYLYGIVSVKPQEKPPFIIVTNITSHILWIRETIAQQVPISRRYGIESGFNKPKLDFP